MAKKEKRTYRVDSEVLRKFYDLCEQKGIPYSEAVEGLMKDFIARSEGNLLDEVHAPAVQQAVKKAMDDQIDRLASMIYNVQIDANAILQSVPVLYQKNMLALEYTLNKYINQELLSPHRDSSAKRFDLGLHGKEMIQDLRKHAFTDLKERKRIKQENM